MPALPLGRLASAFALLGALAGPAAAAPQSPHLSSRLAVLASPAVRSADPARQADAVGLARHGFGSLVRSGDRVVVEVHFRSGAAGRAGELRAAGARVLDMSSRDQTVSALVDPADLHALAAADGVRVVTPVLTPMTSAVDGCRGAATSEGDSQLDASALRSALGVDGSGVKVGVLSDSFDIDSSALTSAADDVASGDLPGAGNPCGRTTPVGVLDDNSSWGGEDEGRAMLQIVHDLAPGAGLAFATAFTGQTGFANNIRQLRAAGAKIIADDVTYADEPFFQDGPIAQAVNDVTASGALYFSSAANNNIRVGGNDAGSWETPSFRNAGSCPSGVLGTQTECEDFDPGAGVDKTFDVTVGPGATVTTDLQWAEPWDGVTTDFDLYLLDASGNDLDPLHDQNADPHTGTQEPFEFGQWTNTSASAKTVRIAIVRNSALGDSLSPRLKLILLENGDDVAPAEYLTSSGGDVVGPTIFGHNGAASAVSVAAVPYDSTSAPEPYSSRGPVTRYFGGVTGAAAAAPALAAPAVDAKPDIAATDCGVTTFFYPVGSEYRFCGTSAAAPHAAAVAALEWSLDPTAPASQIRAEQTSGARPVGAYGHEAVGAGLVDATAVVPAPQVAVASAPTGVVATRTPSFAFSASHLASYACSIDGGAYVACGSPWTAPALADGPHTLVVRATDALGHSSTGSPISFAIDATAPDTAILAGDAGVVARRRLRFSFSSPDPSARFECSIDGAAFGGCSRPGTAESTGALADGLHVFAVRAVDAVGNADPTPAARTVVVDTRAPKVRLRRHPARRTRSRQARFVYSASEAGAKFSCRLDHGRWKPCGSSRRVRVRRGRHVFRVRAVDGAGNAGAAVSFRWTVRR